MVPSATPRPIVDQINKWFNGMTGLRRRHQWCGERPEIKGRADDVRIAKLALHG
jgi:hypothetical protein